MNDGLGECCNGKPFGRGPVGRPAMHWASKFEQFGRIKHWCDWKDMAANASFVQRSRVLFTPVFALVRALKRAALSACEPQTSDLGVTSLVALGHPVCQVQHEFASSGLLGGVGLPTGRTMNPFLPQFRQRKYPLQSVCLGL